MSRLIEVNIAGQPCLLNYSIRASRAIGKRCGGIENLGEYINAKNVDEQTDEFLWILCRLMESGRDYKKVFEGVDVILPDFATLDLLLTAEEVVEYITQAMLSGSETEIEVEQTKNQTPTQAL